MAGRAVHVAVIAAMVWIAAACGSTDSDAGDGTPMVAIDSIDVDGTTARMSYRVTSTGGDVAVTIDWGDGSPLQGFTGQGAQTSLHTYDVDVTSVTVTVTGVDADGNVGSDARSIALVEGATDTSSAAASSTSTAPTTNPASTTDPAGTTPAPPAPAPPPPPPPPPAPAPPPTPAPTTSTTAPPSEPIVIALELDDARLDLTGQAEYSVSRQTSSDQLGLFASTGGFGNAPVVARFTATWEIPASRFADLGTEVNAGVFFETRTVTRLCATNDDFRSVVSLSASGNVVGGDRFGEGVATPLEHDGSGGYCRNVDPERASFGFGGPVDGDLVVSLTARCDVRQPSIALIGAAVCRGPSTELTTVELVEARVTLRPSG